MKATAKFVLEKQTKNAVRYKEEAGTAGPIIETIYIKKLALPTPFPQAITVTVEAA